MKIKLFLLVVLVFVAALVHVSCGSESKGIIKEETLIEPEDAEKITYINKTKYNSWEFVSDDQKREWRSALASLLNNEKTPVYEEGESLVGYAYLYPDRPCIENGYQLALFDFNVDGIPELLVNVGGGSAGNTFYYVYDILSGEEIGTLDGGESNSWCMYFNQSTDKYEAIGQFEWRNGYLGKIHFINKATITNTMPLDKAYLHETSLMCACYSIDVAEGHLTDAELAEGIFASWKEMYSGVRFWVNGDGASIETYFNARDEFMKNYIRITETNIQLVSWDDVISKEDDVNIKAEKMAEALISSNQKFVVPCYLVY